MSATTLRALVVGVLAGACLWPAGAGAHESGAAAAPVYFTGSPTYYDLLGAGDTADRIHRKGYHPTVQQHEGEGGHLPPVSRNVNLVSKLELTGETGRVSDVSALKNYAYLGAYDEPVCDTGGVWIVDIANPAKPRKVGFLPSHEDTYTAEGVHAATITTGSFNGDLLAFSNEICQSGRTSNGVGGMTLYDVSNPRAPKKLIEGFGDYTTKGQSQRKSHQIHSVLMWDAGSRAYAVMIDDEEDLDVDIVDITNPTKPKLISETGLPHWPAAKSDGYGNEDLFHDVEVRKVGTKWIMVASYWDTGYVKLDVTDPANPKYLDDSDFGPTDPEFPGVGAPEGNGHQGNWTRDGAYFVATDEDFSPYRTTPLKVTTGPNAGEYSSQPISGGGPVTVLPDKRLNGPTVYGGYGCNTSAAIPPRSQTLPSVLATGEEAILVLQRGPEGDPSATEEACFPGEKAANGRAAGYDAVVIAGRHLGTAAADEPPYCGAGDYPAEPIVSFCIGHGALHVLFNKMPPQYAAYDPALEPAIGAVGERIDVTAVFDGWGYVRLFDPATMQNLDTYAVPESKLESNAVGAGDLSVHEVDPDPFRSRLMHSSYYSAGYRAIRVVQSTSGPQLQEVGAFIDQGGNNFWGVHPIRDTRPGQEGEALVLLSDRDYGLYVLEHTR
jgi:hypothetical protein